MSFRQKVELRYHPLRTPCFAVGPVCAGGVGTVGAIGYGDTYHSAIGVLGWACYYVIDAMMLGERTIRQSAPVTTCLCQNECHKAKKGGGFFFLLCEELS